MNIYFNPTFNNNQPNFYSRNRIITNTASKIRTASKNNSQQVQKVTALIEQGLSLKKIAKILDISEDITYKISKTSKALKEHKLKRNNDIYTSFIGRETIKSISERIGLSIVTVKDILQKFKAKTTVAENTNDKILEMLTDGFNRKEICETLNVGLSKVKKIASKNQVYKTKIQEREKLILDMIMQGFTRKQIAEELGLNMPLIIKACEKNNGYRLYKAHRDAQIVKMVKAKIPFENISKDWNVSIATIQRVLKKQKSGI